MRTQVIILIARLLFSAFLENILPSDIELSRSLAIQYEMLSVSQKFRQGLRPTRRDVVSNSIKILTSASSPYLQLGQHDDIPTLLFSSTISVLRLHRSLSSNLINGETFWVVIIISPESSHNLSLPYT